MSDETPVLACAGGVARKVETDPKGGPATYGPAVEIPAALSIEVEFEAEKKELKDGRGRLRHAQASAPTGTATVAFKMFSAELDVLFFGSTLVTDVNGDVTVKRTPNDRPNYIELELVSAELDGTASNTGIRLAKVKATKPAGLGLAEDDYKDFEVEVDLFELDADGSWVDATTYADAKTVEALLAGTSGV